MTGDQDMAKVPLHPSGAGKPLRGCLSLGFPGFTCGRVLRMLRAFSPILSRSGAAT